MAFAKGSQQKIPVRLANHASRDQEHAAWLRSLQEKGFELDAKGIPRKSAKN